LKDEREKTIKELKSKVKGLEFLKTVTRTTLLSGHDDAQKKVEIDEVVNENKGGIIGLYFSASWCGPCVFFTPQLISTYQEHEKAGKKLQIVFISSDSDKESFENYYHKMPWLAFPYEERDLISIIKEAFEIKGIPTLILLNPEDGTIITTKGRSIIDHGIECYPYTETKIAEVKASDDKKAIQSETDAISGQALSGPVVNRRSGNPGSVIIDFKENILFFREYSTAFVKNCLVSKGQKAYYEITVTKMNNVCQIGWGTSLMPQGNTRLSEGVGDDPFSWGVDGVRQLKWAVPNTGKFGSEWSVGDVVGLACNLDCDDETSGLSVSLNGSFSSPEGTYVQKEDFVLGEGVTGIFPALTAGEGFELTYNFTGPFKHSPPDASYKAVIEYCQ